MTKHSTIKAEIRAYMAAHGVKYTQARRAVLDGAAGAPPRSPVSLLDDDDWYSPPSLDELVYGELAGKLERLLGEPVAAYRLGLPMGASRAWFHAVEPDASTLTVDVVDDLDGEALTDSTVRARVELVIELHDTEARRLVRAGKATVQHEGVTAGTTAVLLDEEFELEMHAGVLCDVGGERGEFQELFGYSWVE